MAGIKLRVLRPLLYRGEPVSIGTILTVSAAEAADFLDCGPKVELLDPADRPAVLAGRLAEVQQQMRQQGRQMPNPGSPWQPAGTWH